MQTAVLLLTALSTVLVDRRHHAFAAPGAAGAGETARSLKEIEHVVIFMQENRSFNHYFGTMAGTRNFADPNVQINDDGRSVLIQKVRPPRQGVNTLAPWHLAHQGGDWAEGAQCATGGSNSYDYNQASLNHGRNDRWQDFGEPANWGFLKRSEIPIHFSVAEGWTVGDMYQQSSITATNPNRVMLVSGSLNVPGSPQKPGDGGTYLDNWEVPGCPLPNINCYPLNWQTCYEVYEELGVSWQVYQDKNNFGDNPLAHFKNFRDAPADSPLTKKGMSYPGLEKFYQDARAGTLPEVSFIVGPMELSEHPPWLPKDGAWLQQQVIDAVTQSPKYGKTVLLISYDESGGFGDHVTPYHAPKGTPGEWMKDYLGLQGDIFVGPGWRLPFYVVSPFTRGGRVFTEHADHTSQILFVEEWLSSKGYSNVTLPSMVHWRREHMSSLVSMLDFENADTSIPNIPKAEVPSKNSAGAWDGMSKCKARFGNPTAPWKTQPKTFPPKGLIEQGYKQVVGYLTEGRYLVFSSSQDKDEFLLSHEGGSKLGVSKSSTDANRYAQPDNRFVIHYYNNGATDLETRLTQQDGPFLVSTPDKTRWIGLDGTLVGSREAAAPMDIDFDAGPQGGSRGYSIKYAKGGDNSFVTISKGGVSIGKASAQFRFKVLSVSYD
ncbi:non-hemolytic phospholipase C [Nannizzia gypsea CBS 118893]|uniref:Non-hemolytic phospholipase C n=1 Tax=Arthroderma gypseum (strain ATCC MYA-4604 / CBS 118893) TaxID=535722 RepID=E4UZP8_ARTGP|nr:non-hemolytic phospholipase C [Nannizzia gypsea CBS 118893]EFR03578.1 non-hemolytic phospholipase C [Nannizzia gypsea CBS 118893]